MLRNRLTPSILLVCSACAREPTYFPGSCDYLRQPRAYLGQDIKLDGVLSARLGSTDWFEIDCDGRTIRLPVVWCPDATGACARGPIRAPRKARRRS